MWVEERTECQRERETLWRRHRLWNGLHLASCQGWQADWTSGTDERLNLALSCIHLGAFSDGINIRNMVWEFRRLINVRGHCVQCFIQGGSPGISPGIFPPPPPQTHFFTKNFYNRIIYKFL